MQHIGRHVTSAWQLLDLGVSVVALTLDVFYLWLLALELWEKGAHRCIHTTYLKAPEVESPGYPIG